MKFPSSFRFLEKYFPQETKKTLGAIEIFSTETIRGWAFHPDEHPISLSIMVGEEKLDLHPQWSGRQDVANVHGSKALNSGFVCHPDSATQERLAKIIDGDTPIQISANNQVLSMVGEARKTGARLKWDKLNISTHNELVQSNIETWGGFSLRGWVSVCGDTPKSMALQVSGSDIPLDITWNKRTEIASQFGLTSSLIGFEIDLPGYLWESVDSNSDLAFNLMVDEQLLTPSPLIITRSLAARWIEELNDLPDGMEKQFRMLLAMEHLHFSKLADKLSAEALTSIQEFAQRMHLEEFAKLSGIKQAGTKVPTESISNLQLWKAMRYLNTSLHQSQGNDVYEHIIEVLSKLQLKGEAREWFLHLAIQLTCESGELHKLLVLLDSEQYDHLREASYSPQKMSLALPVLVEKGQTEEASNVLRRLRNHIKDGWLHTYCIKYSIDKIQKFEAEGLIAVEAANKFRYEFLMLLDAFRGEWFSRLHDKQLIQSMCRLIADMDQYTDQMRRDVASAAIRNYGLCPTFWEYVKAAGQDHFPSELLRGRAMWEKAHQVIQEWPSGSLSLDAANDLSNRLERLTEPLGWFNAQGNLETVMVLREVVMNSLQALNENLNPAGQTLIKQLLASDWSESVRIAAFPLQQANSLQASFAETKEWLFRTLHAMSECSKSPLYNLQHSAASAIKEASSAENPTEFEKSLAEVLNKSTLLSNWHGNFLGVDLMAAAYSLSINAGLDAEPLLSHLQQNINKAIKDSKSDHYLPAPVLSALTRLHRISDDPLVTALLEEVDTSIRKKFSDIHLDASQPPATPSLAFDSHSWPGDTLVVIISTNERINETQNIRQTWVADLTARGIPHLFVVGHGNDTVNADVLSLDISDGAEDSPKKILRLFDWIHKNTEAQFVLKIEDDCYLNVDSFFDSLSYRKHLYYGRIVRKGVGSIDRTTRIQPAHTGHTKITLDKSPEPSTFADGDGAYTLSRLAISKLIKIKNSPAARRLVSNSTREDKLVGDLLALADIFPSNEDYGSFDRKCMTADSLPIAKGENTFFPGKSTPTKVVHLDTRSELLQAHKFSNSAELWPKKIWPTCWQPSIKHNSNQLELITELDRATPLLKNPIVVVAVMRNEMIMLPHFLDHYRKLGVHCFIIADNCSDDGTREYLWEQPDVVLYSVDTQYKSSHYGVAWQQAILGNLCLGKWVVLADADEFLVYEDCEHKDLATYVAEVESADCDSVFLHMIDMYPFGDLDDACFEKGTPFDVAPFFDGDAQIELMFGGGQFSNSRNFVNGLRHRIAPSRINSYVSQKYALFKYKPWMRLTEGVHYSANMKTVEQSAFFAHFKYHAGFKSKVLAEIKRNQHFNGAEEYQRYAGILAEGKGEFGSDQLSAKYRNSADFVATFK